MKTPTEEIWPGVTSLPDYKPTFPNWTKDSLNSQLKNMDDKGIDLLRKMLVYDPKKRINARDALKHPYFDDVKLEVDLKCFSQLSK